VEISKELVTKFQSGCQVVSGLILSNCTTGSCSSLLTFGQDLSSHFLVTISHW